MIYNLLAANGRPYRLGGYFIVGAAEAEGFASPRVDEGIDPYGAAVPLPQRGRNNIVVRQSHQPLRHIGFYTDALRGVFFLHHIPVFADAAQGCRLCIGKDPVDIYLLFLQNPGDGLL